MIAVDKIGCKILFLNPQTYETETALDGFQRTVHELLVIPERNVAYVPIFGDGIHGRNPNPGHTLWAIDLIGRKRLAEIDLRPYIAPHTVRLGPDGLVYITCENSAVIAVIDPATNKMIDAIPSGSTNGHRLAIPDDGQRLYTDNEEDATVSVIDLPQAQAARQDRDAAETRGYCRIGRRQDRRRRERRAARRVPDRHKSRPCRARSAT